MFDDGGIVDAEISRRSAIKRLLGPLAALGLFELTLRLALGHPSLYSPLRRLDSTACRIAGVNKLMSHDGPYLQGMTTVPMVVDSLLGWRNTPLEYEQDGVAYTISADGTRGHGMAVSGPLVLAYGDSFTFGDEVSDHETWPAHLQQLRPDLQVQNRGVNGYGHDQMLLALQRDGLPLDPTHVVVVFIPADVRRNAATFTSWHKPRFTLVEGSLDLRHRPPEALEDAVTSHRWTLRTLDVARVWYEAFTRPTASETFALTEALLDSMATEIERQGAQAHFVYGPQLQDVARPTAEHSFFTAWCAKADASCADATTRFREAVASGLDPMQVVHWSSLGNRLVAETVAELLEAQETPSD